MHSKELIALVRAEYEETKNLRGTARRFKLTPSTVQYMIANDYAKPKKDVGRPKILGTRDVKKIKREVNRLKGKGEKVNASKVKTNCDLECSNRTVRRSLSALGLKYKKKPKRIQLKRHHKDDRVSMAKKWLSDCFDWKKTVFSDEKKFNLDGPDSWMSWMGEDDDSDREMRQMGGGSVMVWAMLLPNGIVHVFRMVGRINGQYYTDFLETNALPILRKYFGRRRYYFQQDNASIHTCKHSIDWLSSHVPALLSWPSKSPDLNPVENVWKMLVDIVYDRSPYQNTDDLWEGIKEATKRLNREKVETTSSLITGMSSRLVKVIELKGEIINSTKISNQRSK